MIKTSSTRKAAEAAARALRGDRPILHIVTDDPRQMMAIMDEAFFGMDAGEKGAHVRYKSAAVFIQAAENESRKTARNKWLQLLRCASEPGTTEKESPTVLYMSADKDGTLSSKALGYLMDYQEQYCMGEYSREAPVLSRMVLYGRGLTVPTVLEPMVARIEPPPLSEEDFCRILKAVSKPASKEEQEAWKKNPSVKALEAKAKWYSLQLAGFPENMLFTLLREISYAENWMDGVRRLLNEEIAEGVIRREKNMRLKAHGKLDCRDVKNKEVEGLEPVKQWLRAHKENITRNAFENPEDITKGLLLLGLPGTGKSLLAETCARRLGLPLIRLDISRLLGRYVGDSEKNMDQVMEDLTICGAPCVLWIDELDKAYSGVGKEGGGGAVMDRLFGKMLTFMQEMNRTVFLVATANDISAIPPELFRAGRFSQIFSLMLPSFKECKAILGAKLTRHFGEMKDDLVEKLMNIGSGIKRWKHEKLVDRGADDPVRFLTGADLSLLAQEMCTELGLLPGSRCRGDKTEEALCAAMQAVADRCRATVNTHYPMTLERAAASYYKVLEEGAIPANDESNPINAKNYRPGNVQEKCRSDGMPQCLKAVKGLSAYDEALMRYVGLEMDKIIYKMGKNN